MECFRVLINKSTTGSFQSLCGFLMFIHAKMRSLIENSTRVNFDRIVILMWQESYANNVWFVLFLYEKYCSKK